MSIRMLYRICAGAAFVAGLGILLQRLVFDFVAPDAVFRAGTLVPEVGLIALTGLFLKSREALGTVGAWGFFVNFLGLAYLGCIDFTRHYVLDRVDPSVVAKLLAGPTKGLFITLALIFIVGTVLFSVSLLLRSKYSRTGVVLYMLGFVAFALNAWIPLIAATVSQLVGAVGVILLGRSLWMLNEQEAKA